MPSLDQKGARDHRQAADRKLPRGRSLHARTLPTQKTEAKVACKAIKFMTSLGMPVSRRVA